MAAVQSLLDNVDVVIKGRSFEEIVRSSYSCQVECSAQATQGALELVKELMSNGGIPIASLKKSEVEAFIKDAPKADADTFTVAEYQALIETLTKYAALKARHNPGKRWGLSLGLSAAGAIALTAAVFTPAGLVLIAAPAGAAIGAVAAAADGSKARRRDRRTAKQGSSSSTSAQAPTAAADAPELAPAEADVEQTTESADAAVSTEDIAPAGEADAIAAADTSVSAATEAPSAPAAAAAEAAVSAAVVSPPEVPAPAAPIPAPVPSSGGSSPRGSSDGMVSAVVDLTPPAAADAADALKPAAAAEDFRPAAPMIDVQTVTDDGVSDVPAPVKCDSPFTAAAKDTSSTVFGELPSAPPAVRTSFGDDLTSSAAGLPPKPKKSKSLTKSMSKKLKKAFSIKDSSSSGKDAGAHKALDADSDSPLAPPVPPRRSATFFRRSSDSTGGSFFRRSSSDLGEVEGVEGSKGSATIKKMVEGIRRSFSLDRPSMDLVTPKKARKAV